MADDTIDPTEIQELPVGLFDGDRTVLWNAIVFCAVHRIANWKWLADEIAAVSAAEGGKIATRDDVFGRHPQLASHGVCKRARRFEARCESGFGRKAD
jgi:hypothetical protein